MLLLLQGCLVCPLARQQENMCPTTLHSGDRTAKTSPSLCAQDTEEEDNAADAPLMYKKVNILKQFLSIALSSQPSLALPFPLLRLIVYRVTSSQRVTSSASTRSCEAPYSQINWYIFSSLCACVCVCECARWCVSVNISGRQKEKKKVSVRLLIYDAVSVINTALLSHLDALIDTCSGGAYGPGTRAASLTVPTWVTLSELEPVHPLFALK